MTQQLALPYLDPDEARVLAALAGRHGQGCAILAPALAAALEMDERTVRMTIARLRRQHGAPILSSPGRPAGYYLPADLAEVDRCLASLRGRALATLANYRALRRHRARLAGQLALEVPA